MSDRQVSPVPVSPQSQGAGHYRAEDDIELPPVPGSGPPEATASSTESDGGKGRMGRASFLGAAALLAALLVGGWYFMGGESAEEQHPNWRHVAAANQASDSATSRLVHLDAAGASHVLPAIELSRADTDRRAATRVRSAMRRNDLITATAALQSAQGLPTASQDPDVQPPQIVADSDLAKTLKEGSELYKIELFDCCDEDGDIVEVVVNGAPFARVPIAHRGTKLAIPLKRGNNTVSIRGVKDGGGGVTLSFRTSRGDYFARAMKVGETYQIGVVVR